MCGEAVHVGTIAWPRLVAGRVRNSSQGGPCLTRENSVFEVPRDNEGTFHRPGQRRSTQAGYRYRSIRFVVPLPVIWFGEPPKSPTAKQLALR